MMRKGCDNVEGTEILEDEKMEVKDQNRKGTDGSGKESWCRIFSRNQDVREYS